MQGANEGEARPPFAEITLERLDGTGAHERVAPWERRLSHKGRAWRLAVGVGTLGALLLLLFLITPNASMLLGALFPQPAPLPSPEITVATTIPWAHVWIDGKERDGLYHPFLTTPGTHTVVIRAAGFAPLTARFTFNTANRVASINYTPQPTPQAAAAMSAAMNDALTRIYHSVATVPVAPGQIYAPGRIARVPLRGTLDLVVGQGDTALSCQRRDPHPDALPACTGVFQFNGPYVLDPSYALLIIHVTPQITITTTDGHPVLVQRLTLPDRTPVEARILLLLRPAGSGWSAQVLVPFPPGDVDQTANVLEEEAGYAALQTMAAGAIAQLHPTYLPSAADGVLFTGSTTDGLAPVWLYRWGLLYALNSAAQRLTPRALVAPPTLTRLAGARP